MSNLELEVSKFIMRRFQQDCNWLNGNCFYFALILSYRFGGKIYYDPVDGHFLTEIDNEFFDYNGKVSYSDNYISFDSIAEEDISHYNRLFRDCIA